MNNITDLRKLGKPCKHSCRDSEFNLIVGMLFITMSVLLVIALFK